MNSHVLLYTVDNISHGQNSLYSVCSPFIKMPQNSYMIPLQAVFDPSSHRRSHGVLGGFPNRPPAAHRQALGRPGHKGACSTKGPGATDGVP